MANHNPMSNDNQQERITVMDISQVELREQIIRLEGRMDVLEANIENISKRLDRLESNQRWIIGLMIGLHGVTIGAIFAAAALF